MTEDRDFYPYEVPKPGEPQCEADGTREGPNGGDHYWSCTAPGTVDVDGSLLCEDHAGERGYGPKQAEYGYDPDDGLNPTPDGCCGHAGYGCSCGPACKCGCPGCPACHVGPARELGRRRAAELFAESPEWLGI